MREITEGAKVLVYLLIAAAIFGFGYKQAADAYTNYLDKNFAREEAVRNETRQDEQRRVATEKEEQESRKAEATARMKYIEAQNQAEQIKLARSAAEIELLKKDIELRTQTERTAKAMADLDKSVQSSIEKAAAVKVPLPTWTFTLKDGTVIKTTRCIETDKEWTIRTDKGEFVSIAKDTIQSVR